MDHKTLKNYYKTYKKTNKLNKSSHPSHGIAIAGSSIDDMFCDFHTGSRLKPTTSACRRRRSLLRRLRRARRRRC